MKLKLPILALCAALVLFAFLPLRFNHNGAPPYYIEDGDQTEQDLSYPVDWHRPAGPAKVGLQVGHWKNEEIPDELQKLRGNTGASGGGKTEWEVNYAIAQKVKNILEDKGVVVEILPATVPPRYWADVFIAIHADGNPDTGKTGYKAAASRRDMTGKAAQLIDYTEYSYGRITGLEKDNEITRNMTGYYAFSWWRFNHTVHPMTTAVIFETGFLTNPSDRQIIVDNPELSAKGIATGILAYLESEKLL